MKKAKAFFTLGIITIVAGASAVCLYLDNKGMLSFSEDMSVVETTVAVQDDYYGNEYENNEEAPEPDVNNEEQEDENNGNIQNEEADEEEAEKLDTVSVNEFLSIFSGLYFSERYDYSEDKFNSYELLKFAYLYAEGHDNSKGIVTGYQDGENGMLNGIEASAAERIVSRFFGVEIPRESAFTENSYQYFMYRDGYFYTPAADGISHENVTVADTVVKNSDSFSVTFTIYSDGVTSDMTAAQAKKNGTVYAKGEAELVSTSDGYRLTRYSLDF